MTVGILEVKLHAPFVHSLKEKRMVLKSLIAKLRNKFNLSVCECAEHDIHQILVIGIAVVTNHTAECDRLLNQIINYIEENSEAVILDIFREIQ